MQKTLTSITLNRLIIVFLILNVLAKLFFISKPIEFIDSVAFPDDTYISLFLAQQIAEGHGPLYGDNFTNGFQPLYVFLSVPFYLLFDSDKITPLYAALIFLLIFDCLSLVMLMKTTDLIVHNKYANMLTGIFWVSSPYVLLTSMNGLETIISFFFIVSSFYYFFKFRDNIEAGSSFKQLILLGVLCGLAVFSRIDNTILAAVILVLIIIDKYRNKKSIKELFYSSSVFIFSTTVIVLPWLIYSYLYTGELFQSSGEGVRFQNLSLKNHFTLFSPEQIEIVLYGFRIILIKNISLIVICGLCLIILLFRFRKRTVQELKNRFHYILPALAFCLLLFCSYVFYIYGMWFFKRYFFPIVFLFVILMSVLIDSVLTSITNRKSASRLVVFFSVIILFINLTRNDSKEVFLNNNSNSGYMTIGKWVSDNFEDGTVIGSMQSGAMSYFAENLEVINLDGVVNKDALAAAKNKRLMDYVREMKIDYIIGWDANIDFLIRESAGFKKEDLTKEFTITGFKTWEREWSVYKVSYPR
jgi:hypothetical protein